MSPVRYGIAATHVGDLALFAGGTDGDTLSYDTVDVFNSATRQWSTEKLSMARVYPYATSIGTLALFASILGGNTTNSVDIFDTSTGQWTVYPMCTELTSVTAVTAVGNYSLYWGASDNTTANVVCRFDVRTKQWTIDELGPKRVGPAATSVGKYALFAGGALEFAPNSTIFTTNLVSIFNSETLQWTTATLSQARYNIAATSAGNLAFFGGGYNQYSQDPFLTVYDTVDIFDSQTLTWSVNYLSKPRLGLAATSVGPYILFGGGNIQGVLTPDVDIYDTSTKLWTYARLAEGRYQLVATSAGRFAFFTSGIGERLRGVIDIFEFPELTSNNDNAPVPSSAGVPVPTATSSNSNTPVTVAPVAATSGASRYCWIPLGFGALGWLLFLQ